MTKEIVPDITSDYYNPKLTENQIIIKKLKQIMNRVDATEEKINQLNDPYFNDYFRSQNNRLPEGYTLVDTSGKSDTSRTFGAIIDG